MWTYYADILITGLTVFLAYMHKRISERPVPIREIVHQDENNNNGIKMSA